VRSNAESRRIFFIFLASVQHLLIVVLRSLPDYCSLFPLSTGPLSWHLLCKFIFDYLLPKICPRLCKCVKGRGPVSILVHRSTLLLPYKWLITVSVCRPSGSRINVANMTRKETLHIPITVFGGIKKRWVGKSTLCLSVNRKPLISHRGLFLPICFITLLRPFA